MASRGGRSAHILVVDDSGVERSLFKHALQKAGHTAQVATTGEAALGIIDATHIDLVLLDVNLPG